MSSLQKLVALRAGVSQSTVSRALRNHQALPAATRERIQSIASAMGYVANPLLSSVFSSLRRPRSREPIATLAYFTAHSGRTSWHQVPTYRDYFRGACAQAALYGFSVEHHWSADPGLSGRRISRILSSRGIAGIILGTRGESKNVVAMDWPLFAMVRLGFFHQSIPCHCVVNNYSQTVRMVTSKLAERGYQRIGLVLTLWQHARTDHNWLAGFLSWQASLPESQRVPVHLHSTITRESIAEWRSTCRPDAVIAVNPDALAHLRAIVEPGDAAPAFALLDRHDEYGDIAGAMQNTPSIAAIAVDVLIGLLRDNYRGLPAQPQTILVNSVWRDGATAPSCERQAQFGLR